MLRPRLRASFTSRQSFVVSALLCGTAASLSLHPNVRDNVSPRTHWGFARPNRVCVPCGLAGSSSCRPVLSSEREL